MASGVAHDFNNVLTVILNHADIGLRSVDAHSPLSENLQEIRSAAGQAAALTRQLLALTRPEGHSPKVVHLSRLLFGIEDMLRRFLGEYVQLVVLVADDLGRVELDPSEFHRVIMNLVVNARDAMPDGGTLTLSCTNVEATDEEDPGVGPRAFVRLTVRDTGIGMDEVTKARVFEPFFTTKGVGAGTGLGLSTVCSIVRQCGGYVSVQSEPQKGTSFQINFPRSDAASPVELADNEASRPLARGTETILVVDDDINLLRAASQALASVGYHVLASSSGADALRRCRRYKGPIHVALSDVMMPGMTGAELGARLKVERPETRVVLMSGHSEKALGRLHIADTGTRLLPKPFDSDELVRAVRDVLDVPRDVIAARPTGRVVKRRKSLRPKNRESN